MGDPNHYTVGQLLDGEVRVTWFCSHCSAAGQADLQRIAREKGRDYSMMDRLPLCIEGDCLGVLRFKAFRGARSDWLLTRVSERQVQAHSDWAFTTRNTAQKREAQRLRRLKAPRRDR